MTCEEMIEEAKRFLEERDIPFGEFWMVEVLLGGDIAVWFWADDKDMVNPSVRFDGSTHKALWCNR